IDVTRALPLPPLPADTPSPSPYWHEERVQPGDTIGSLLARPRVRDAAAMTYLRIEPAARPLYQLRPGRPLEIATDAAGRLPALRSLAADGNVLAIARDGDAFRATLAAPRDDVRVEVRAGVIESSLFGAA